MRSLRVALATVVAVATSLAPALGQPAERDYLARPTRGSQRSSTGDYFVVAAKRGAKVKQALEVRNVSEVPLDLVVDAVGATTADTGGVDYASASDPIDGVGRWVDLSSSELRIAPGERATVPFTIRVPQDAREGVNIGGLVLQSQEDLDADEDIQNRTVIAVQVNTPGSRSPDLVVSGVTVVPRIDAMYLDVGISNEGSGFAKATGTVRLTEEVFEGELNVDTFVPGTTINYPVRWTSDPAPGTYTAEVTLQYGEGRTAEWTGQIEVTPRAIAELPGARASGDAGDEGGIGSLPLLVAAGVLGLIAIALVFGRRGKTGPVIVLDAETHVAGGPASSGDVRSKDAGAAPDSAEPLPAPQREEVPPEEPAAVTRTGETPTDTAEPERTPAKESSAPRSSSKTGAGEKNAADRSPRKSSVKKKTTKKKTTAKKTATKKAGTKKTSTKKTATKKPTTKSSAAKTTKKGASGSSERVDGDGDDGGARPGTEHDAPED